MKRRTTNMAVATALAASVLVLAGCGGGSDDDNAATPTPTPSPTPATPPPASPPPASPPPASPPPASPPPASPPPASPPPASPPPAANTIPLASTYGPTTFTCTLGDNPVTATANNVTVTYASDTLNVSDPASPPAVDIVWNAGTTGDPNPVGTDDQPTAPTSATYNGKATVGADPYVLTMSIEPNGNLLGVLYNPDPVDDSPAEIARIEAERVRCGNQIQ